jgi:low affinity Fe/Cu permease
MTYTIIPANQFNKNHHILEKLSAIVTGVAGSNVTISLAFIFILAWVIAGPFFDYSDNWKWTLSIGTAIITFLMVFLIQKSQNKDTLAIHIKLNEVLKALETANNKIINVENIAEDEMKVLQEDYSQLSKEASDNEK